MKPSADRTDEQLFLIAKAVHTAVTAKSAWLNSMQTWGQSSIACDQAFIPPSQGVRWREGDREFHLACDSLRKAEESQLLERARQRGIRGDVASQALAHKAVRSKVKADADQVPEPEYTPMTRQEAADYIAAGLAAAGIETPDDLSVPVYSEEQWAKWGR